MTAAATQPNVGIVGGGLLGLTVAYRLACAGTAVTVYERDGVLGGLAAASDLDGIPVDRYYHVTLPTDDRIIGLAAELGLGEDQFRFRRIGSGFYHEGRLASMSTPRELLAFPGLALRDRVRLAAFGVRCATLRNGDHLEDIPLETWLRDVSGDRLWEQVWRPLLDSKFDGRYDDLPATYMWARMRRTGGTRDRRGQEVYGWLSGGYQSLIDRLAVAITERGGRILTSTPVRSIPSQGGRPIGVLTEEGLKEHDTIVTTQLRPALDAMLSDELRDALGADRNRYLGVVCLVARVKRSVSPYYALNITDRRVPLTSIVETTHVVDPEQVGGTLLYVPRYVDPSSPELERPSSEIRREYLGHVRTIFPQFHEDDVLAAQVARARVAEPVHVLGAPREQDSFFPVPGLAVASTAQVYPELVNGQAVVGVAERLVAELRERLSVMPLEEAVA